ncbi:MAG TPA: shikimate dehydrogenase [Geminicoccus sp.]|jgi:shikimate dehydrogenase|uniref:shikimate dehydrogenase n=1 Tax=Geminicoccus sp. TaxID=2024832 RepID=UPI002E326AB7|nr:shikimate dehydrogenase [Geminicoccus sp.]HEX2528831.1 shikimate dehydrogenase [Geminicoccus sp.]
MLTTGAARVAGVMGWPITHSLSPVLHGHWFRRHGIDGAYVPLAVRPDDAIAAIRMLPKLGFLGCNVTQPHKEAAFAAVDLRDAVAARMGVVNTVMVQSDGSLIGTSTDGAGFMANLREQAPDWRPEQGPAVLLGTGGAARAVAITLLDAGVLELRLVNRTVAKADALAADLRLIFQGRRIDAVGWQERSAALEGAGLLVQATSLGMKGQPNHDLQLDGLPLSAPVAELVYVPLETELTARARRRGHRIVDGLGMLLHQAVPGFAHWGGVTPTVDAEARQIVLEVLRSRR